MVPRLRTGARHVGELAGSAQLHANTVICLCDAQGVVQYITPNAQRVLGEACERAPELGLTLGALLQPEDPAEGARVTDRLLRTDCESNLIDLLTRAPSGGPRWLEIQSRNLLNEGAIAAFLLEIRDVTLRRVDDRLREMVRTAMQHLPDSVMLTDSAGIIRFVNPAFEQATGYSATEAIGQTPAMLKSGQHQPEVYQKLWRCISSGQIWEGELCNRRQNGELYYEHVMITPIHEERGSSTHFLSAARDVTALKRTAEVTAQDAYYDALTGLPVARLLRERAASLLALARRHGHSAALLHIDVDSLGSLNQTHGRSTGDEVLRRLAERFRQGLRDSDTIARLDGTDEFLVLLSEVTDEDAAAQVVRRLRERVSQPFDVRDTSITLTVTIGVALCPEDASSFDELAAIAAESLHRARANGQAAGFSSPELTQRTNERLSLEDDFKWAWERRQFVLHYQPVLALESITNENGGLATQGRTSGLEALARWPHLERGLVEAVQFIPMAERTGHVVKLDHWAIESASRQLATWSSVGWQGWIAVNLSMRSLHDPDLPAFLDTCLKQHHVDPARMVLDIAESAALFDADLTTKSLRQLQRVGVKIALDDIGLNSDSLACFWSFPIDLLKVHHRAVRDIGYDAKIERLIEAILVLAHRVGAQVIAQGVEEEAQLEWLRVAGCDHAQGYLIGRPQSVDSLETPDFKPSNVSS
ncbi:MAG: putative bifunctional diguanylate cyclase/phosphodiesterase [Longimicrobiales bacterium]